MIQKDLGPFPNPRQLNKWADQEPGSRDSIAKRVGKISNKVRSISHSSHPSNISKHQRKFGTGFATSKRLKNLDIHKY
jgi:hypothetical protein